MAGLPGRVFLTAATRMTLKSFILAAATLLSLLPSAARATDPDPFSWPTPTCDSRPWTRWWWLGSAIDEQNLTHLLEQYHSAGLGGVEICPIYGAKGAEPRYLPHLSDPWLRALAHTTKEAQRLGMGVDLTTGTGWPFGGPHISQHQSSASFSLKSSADGKYEIAAKSPIQKVKRAAPGGEGNVLDPYSTSALTHYLTPFSTALAKLNAPLPRAHFHDSFEYFNANWTPTFLDDFQRLRGYDLRDHLPALAGQGDPETAARVRHDYRETISDLHLAFLQTYSDWAHAHQGLARNQAHGSPTNLLDAYAIADIPETETFGPPSDQSIVFLKFASSAAHLTGRPLASAESFTWLGEHFQTSLADCKPAADLLFTAGINHLIFHGTPYSPQDAGFPGWLFYASVHFGPQGGLFPDLPAFTAYLTRVQSALQSGRPDTDLLLYFPHHDLWQTASLTAKDPLLSLRLHNIKDWLTPTPFLQTATDLLSKGYTVDFVSDRLLQRPDIKDRCRAIVIPPTKFMPPETARRLADLAHSGLPVLFQGEPPTDVPGLHNLHARRAALKSALSQLGTGNRELGTFLKFLPREPLVDTGLRFTRLTHPQGHLYFLSNPTGRPFDGWLPLSRRAATAILLDPLAPDRTGTAALRHRRDATTPEIYLQLPPGASLIVRTFSTSTPQGPTWTYRTPARPSTPGWSETQPLIPLTDPWQVTFTQGGPELPQPFTTQTLSSWTNRDDPEAKRFAGTARYTTTFPTPTTRGASDYLLDLGRVADSARVTLNGHTLPTLWCPPYSLPVGPHFRKDALNELTVEVTNLAANRIADLDRRKIPWKSFHEINFVNKDYKPFDASTWPPRPSGLLGPVQLVPLRHFTPTTENP